MDNQQGNLMCTTDKCFEVMAYSIGAMLGDGTVGSYVVKCRDGMTTTHNTALRMMDLECVQRVCDEINSLFDKSYTVVPYFNPNGTKMYQLAIGSGTIYRFFEHYVGEKLLVPDEAFRASRKAKVDFIAGLFDSDGYVTSHSGYYRVGFASRHRSFVEDVSRLLQKIGVKVGKIYTQTSAYNTTMSVIKPNIRSFIESGCYFRIPRKAEKLAKYEGSVRKPLHIKTFRDYNTTPMTMGEDIVQQ